MANETLNFDELPHEDDWADATTREDGDVTEAGLMYLAALEEGLIELSKTPEVQQFIKGLRSTE